MYPRRAHRYLGRGALAGVAALCAAATLATPAPAVHTATGLPAGSRLDQDRKLFLRLAGRGITAARAYWWNTQLGWYDDRRDNSWNENMPLARLWTIFPLFEAVNALALANPTPKNVAAVRRFSRAVRRYWNPDVGAFSWYPGMRGNRQTFFDDNGWFAIAFVDAYRVTGDPADLATAVSAYRFIVEDGWDEEDGGGTWWDTTASTRKTSEPLAAAIYVGAFLYEQTRGAYYLQTTRRLLTWADTKGWNRRRSLYGRNARDGTVMNYVQGMMIGAHVTLCTATGAPSYCDRAQELAEASLVAFPVVAPWAPGPDAIYLRFLLDLYRRNGDERWYALAHANARRALAVGRNKSGVFVRRWRDGRQGPNSLRDHAATISLFAWLAGARPPR